MKPKWKLYQVLVVGHPFGDLYSKTYVFTRLVWVNDAHYGYYLGQEYCARTKADMWGDKY